MRKAPARLLVPAGSYVTGQVIGAGGATKWALEEVAAGIADAAEAPQLPLRIPIGRTAGEVLAARRAAPDDGPFIPGAPTAVRSSASRGG